MELRGQVSVISPLVILSRAKDPVSASHHAARHSYWVYLLTNKRNGTLYVGVTNSLERRVREHKAKLIEGFTKQDGLTCLVHFELFRDVIQAIAREKELKGWRRKRKLELIETGNPSWTDLSAARTDNELDVEPSLLARLRTAQNDKTAIDARAAMPD